MRLDPSVLLLAAACAFAAQVACGSSPATPTRPADPRADADAGANARSRHSARGQRLRGAVPSELAMINVKLHIKAPEYFTLDSTPLVGPSSEYCRDIGYTDGRQYCPVRLEQDSERKACEAWVIGNAKDTGKPGPTWIREWETYCTTFAESGCEHNPDNPFSLFIQMGGWYQACRGMTSAARWKSTAGRARAESRRPSRPRPTSTRRRPGTGAPPGHSARASRSSSPRGLRERRA